MTDNATGLIWKRCPEGMSWIDSTCTGPATTYTHQAALQYAQTQTGWRLPNVKELSSLVDRSRTNPAIDPTAFPNVPSFGFWSSSPIVGNSDYAWHVHFNDGDVNSKPRRNADLDLVRLVR